MPQILEPGTGPRTRKVTFAGGFSKWQDFAGIRTMVRYLPMISFTVPVGCQEPVPTCSFTPPTHSATDGECRLIILHDMQSSKTM